VILAVDAKAGRVAIQGWMEVVSVEVNELVKRFEGTDLSAIIFTDIERDGMGAGVNLASTQALAKITSIPVIASGGVSKVEEVEQLARLEPPGVAGVIIGRALYTGQIDLEEAIRAAKKAGEIG
jgi:phosphoribosylformimino-5-aminoimidazole carboxamide ribotide isomerase